MEPSEQDGQVALHPLRLLFPGRLPGTWSDPEAVALTNDSAFRLFIQSTEISGPHGSDFLAEDLSGMRLFPGNACSVGVRFRPTETGWRTAELRLFGTDGRLLWRVALVGYGASLELVGDCPDLTVRKRDIATVAVVSEGRCEAPVVACGKAELIPGAECEQRLCQELLVAVPIAVQVQARCEESCEPVSALFHSVAVQPVRVTIPLHFEASSGWCEQGLHHHWEVLSCGFHIVQRLQVEVPITYDAEVASRFMSRC